LTGGVEIYTAIGGRRVGTDDPHCDCDCDCDCEGESNNNGNGNGTRHDPVVRPPL